MADSENPFNDDMDQDDRDPTEDGMGDGVRPSHVSFTRKSLQGNLKKDHKRSSKRSAGSVHFFDQRGPFASENLMMSARDRKEWSADPSFTDFEIPYVVKCYLRYVRINRKYNKQFLHETKLLETFQVTAYEAARFNRHLCITTLWPPLHTRKEIDYFQRKFFKHTPSDQKRLNYLLKEVQL